jgi:hypothetical protein
MNSMMAAIKSKRGGSKGGAEEVYVEEGQSKAPMMSNKPDMKSFVDQMDDAQKQELLALLTESIGGEEGASAEGVEKGEPSPKEKQLIAQKSEEEGEGLPEEESDNIAMSMIDRQAERMNEQGGKPRNLSERAKMYMASKLKQKGKI